MSVGPRIALVAGEASGDVLASHLIVALRRVLPNARFYGIGGPKMEAAGCEIQVSCERLAVHGLVEVLKHLREIYAIRRRLLKDLLDNPPDLFIGVDAPDFNFGLERKLRQKGIRVVHYVSPSLWAWRGGRIKGIAKAVDHILTLFPFEPAIYAQAGVPATFVGHPLADLIPLEVNVQEARDKLDLDGPGKIFALLPGSRRSEVANLSGIFIDAARLLLKRFPNSRFLVPLATRQTRLMFEEMLWQKGAQELPFTLLFGHAHDALAAADGVLVASGTAALEVALFKKPMVIAYKVRPLSYRLWKRMALLPYVGLPNVLSEDFVVPELLQDDATPENLAQALANLVDSPQVVKGLERRFQAIHLTLRQGTAEKAAAAILPLISQGKPWSGGAA